MLRLGHLTALRAELHALAADAVSYANSLAPDLKRTWRGIQWRGPGGSQTFRGLRTDVDALHKMTAAVCDQFPAFDRLLAAAAALPDAATMFTDASGTAVPDERRRRHLDEVLAQPFVARYVHRSPFPLDFDADRADDAIRALAESLEAADTTYVETMPLLNVVLTVDEIPLGGGVWLRTAPDDEVMSWVNAEELPEETGLHVFAALDRRYAVPVGQGVVHDDLLDPYPALIGLLSDADCRVPMREHRSVGIDGGLLSWSAGELPPTYGRRGTVRAEDGERLARWADRAKAHGEKVPLELALRRWQGAINRSTEEDEIVDYWIALEALFAADSQAELRFRCSLRIAAYVGTSADERQTIYAQMLDSYNLRSAIVHGGKQKGHLPGLTEQTRQCLRRALIRILDADELTLPTAAEAELLARE